jgi:hypothetical protein
MPPYDLKSNLPGSVCSNKTTLIIPCQTQFYAHYVTYLGYSMKLASIVFHLLFLCGCQSWILAIFHFTDVFRPWAHISILRPIGRGPRGDEFHGIRGRVQN